MLFGLSQRLEDHRQEDARQFSELKREITGLRADLDRKHVENQAAITLLGKDITTQGKDLNTHEAAAQRASQRILFWVIGILLTVLGSILVQSIHFKITLG